MRALVVIVAAAALVISGCAPGAAPAASPGAPSRPNFDGSTTLTIRLNGSWSTFEPSPRIGNLPSSWITRALYDRLVLPDADGKILPYMATSWEASSTRVKFTLRDGITCADGTPLTATAIAKHFEQKLGIKDPNAKSPFAAAEFGVGPYTVSADDATRTFTLTLGTPFGGALDGFASGGDGMIVCPKGVENPALLETQPFGSGPYTVESADPTTAITLKLRADWKWGPDGRTSAGLPGKIVYKIIANETTATNALLTGELDIARITNGPDIKRLLDNQSVGRQIKAPLYHNPMWLNMNAGHPTADIAVREALVTAISSEEFNLAAYAGLGTPVTSLFSSNAPCYESKTAGILPKKDIDRAKQVLRTAGYPTDASGKFMKKDGSGPLTIQVVGSTAQGSGPEYFQAQLTSLGVKVNFIVVEHTVYSSDYLAKGNWDVIVPGIAADVLSSYMAFYYGNPPVQGGRNYSWNSDTAFGAKIQKALQQSGDEACATWKEVQMDWVRNFYGRPLSSANFYWFFRDPKWSFISYASALEPSTLK